MKQLALDVGSECRRRMSETDVDVECDVRGGRRRCRSMRLSSPSMEVGERYAWLMKLDGWMLVVGSDVDLGRQYRWLRSCRWWSAVSVEVSQKWWALNDIVDRVQCLMRRWVEQLSLSRARHRRVRVLMMKATSTGVDKIVDLDEVLCQFHVGNKRHWTI